MQTIRHVCTGFLLEDALLLSHYGSVGEKRVPSTFLKIYWRITIGMMIDNKIRVSLEEIQGNRMFLNRFKLAFKLIQEIQEIQEIQVGLPE